MYELKQGDCLELMKEIPSDSIDFVLCDLPYGCTDCAWDKPLPLDVLWGEYQRIVKPTGTSALFCIQPFTTQLISTNYRNFRFMWYWRKNNITGGPFAKVQPMRCVEEIAVFAPASSYNNAGKHLKLREYFFEELKKSGLKRNDVNRILGSTMSSHYFTRGNQYAIPTEEAYAKLQAVAPGCFTRPFREITEEYGLEVHTGEKTPCRYTYNPQGLRPATRARARAYGNRSVYKQMKQSAPQEFEGYPNHLLFFDQEVHNGSQHTTGTRLHPTQKPVALLEYLIRTHTNAGDMVLDNTMGSGSTGVACIHTDRNFIGFELNETYFEIAKKRIENVVIEHKKELSSLQEKEYNNAV